MTFNLILDHRPRGNEVMEMDDGIKNYEEDGKKDSSEEDHSDEYHIYIWKVVNDPS